jgi:hypothetical protein
MVERCYAFRSRHQPFSGTADGRSRSARGVGTKAGTDLSSIWTTLGSTICSCSWPTVAVGSSLLKRSAAAAESSWVDPSTRTSRSPPADRCHLMRRHDRYSPRSLAGFPSGQRGVAVNHMALPSQVRILPPPSLSCLRRSRTCVSGGPQNVGDRSGRTTDPAAVGCVVPRKSDAADRVLFNQNVARHRVAAPRLGRRVAGGSWRCRSAVRPESCRRSVWRPDPRSCR